MMGIQNLREKLNFTGVYEKPNVENKGRVCVPRDFRKEIERVYEGKNYYILVGKDNYKKYRFLRRTINYKSLRCIIFSHEEYELRSSELKQKGESDLESKLFFLNKKCEFDSQGRIKLNKYLLDHIGLSDAYGNNNKNADNTNNDAKNSNNDNTNNNKYKVLFVGRAKFFSIYNLEEGKRFCDGILRQSMKSKTIFHYLIKKFLNKT